MVSKEKVLLSFQVFKKKNGNELVKCDVHGTNPDWKYNACVLIGFLEEVFCQPLYIEDAYFDYFFKSH